MVSIQLIQQAKKGNEDAVKEIFTMFNKLILLKSRKYFFYGAERDDVIQEAAIGLLKAITAYKEGRKASFITFATLCIQRQLITAIKSSNSGKHRILNLAMNNAIESFEFYDNISDNFITSSKSHSPEDIYLSKEKIYFLKQYLKSHLSKMENQIFDYMVLEMNYIEIAQYLNYEPKSVDNAIQRIKRKLKAFLADYEKI